MARNAGTARRLRRIVDGDGRSVVLPLDIVVPCGPFQGAAQTGPLVDLAGETGVDAVILRWGEARRFADRLAEQVGLVVRISGATELGGSVPVQLNTVSASLALGADAVCIDVEVGNDHEAVSLQRLSAVCEEAERLGVPVMAEVHVDPDGRLPLAHALGWAARTAQELGADLVKLAAPGSAAAMATISEQAHVPLLVAGGDPRDPRAVLAALAEAMRGGAAGSAVGRNVIGHPAPAAMQRAVIDVVRRGRPADAVYDELEVTASV